VEETPRLVVDLRLRGPRLVARVWMLARLAGRLRRVIAGRAAPS
jgi:hypothetical protein